MSVVLEIDNLSKEFAGRSVLEQVGFSIHEGEMVALIGASGSGKSTLMRHIPGFIKGNSGVVSVLGEIVQSEGKISPSIRKIRSRVGFVFQQFNLVGRLPVMTNVLIGVLAKTPFWSGMLMRFSVAYRQKALEALTAVGIEQTAWQRASTLSGGQQQRAALARCLVQDAQLVVADEPIASLDPESSRKVMELLAKIHRQRRCAVLVSLHQVDYAIRWCPRTIALKKGRVFYDGPTSGLTQELLNDIYGADIEGLQGLSTSLPAESSTSFSIPIVPGKTVITA